jgi:hypothetical protein
MAFLPSNRERHRQAWAFEKPPLFEQRHESFVAITLGFSLGTFLSVQLARRMNQTERKNNLRKADR